MSLEQSPLCSLPIRGPSTGRAILLTSYMTGANDGKNLGVAGYSYDIVVKLFLPLLQRWGEVIPVANPRETLESAADEARRRNLEPVHVSFLPFQDVCLSQSAPNVVVPAWEFPDVPDHEFNGNPQNNWPAMANRCSVVLVGGPFTLHALRKAGTKAPLRIVQIPTPEEYFSLPPWDPSKRVTLECSAFAFPAASEPLPEGAVIPMDADVAAEKPPPSGIKRIGKALEFAVRSMTKRLLGPTWYRRITHPLESFWRAARSGWDESAPLPPSVSSVELSGVVYSSIFNPRDGRKNWQDLLTGFLYAIGGCEDATLVLKLITSDPQAVRQIVNYYLCRDIPHRCKVVFIGDYLSGEQMLQLAEASTYYLQTTKAEGNCLPLMNYLAAGRPGVSPAHSAIADYFDGDVGFLVDWHPQPAAWPHDKRLRCRTTWARLVWPSLVQQIRRSYEIAKGNRAAYEALAGRGRARMHEWASVEKIWPRLHAALELASAADSPEASLQPLERKRAA